MYRHRLQPLRVPVLVQVCRLQHRLVHPVLCHPQYHHRHRIRQVHRLARANRPQLQYRPRVQDHLAIVRQPLTRLRRQSRRQLVLLHRQVLPRV